MTINESGVYFFPGGGHNHDGQNSTLIDTNAYSVFDFGWGGFVGTPSRVAKQILNRDSFLQLVSSVVQDTLYETIRFQPGSIGGSSIIAGTITANEIAANTITANLLAANVVLVNQTISSNNYVAGVSGWKISGDGTAEFDAAVIRGTLTAAAVSTPGVDIYSNGMLSANNFTIFANGAIQNNNFSVSESGTLTATNANISGTIIATSVSTPGVDIYSNGVLAASNFVILANGAFGNNNFSVDASGNLTAINADISGEINSTVGTIGGFAIGATSLSATGSQGYLNLNADAGGIELEQGNYFISMYASLLYGGFNNVINFVIDPGNGSAAFSGINLTNGISMNTGTVNGDGISYPGCTTGPGTPNNMGLVWNNPDIRGTVDNVVSAVLGTVSDIRFKTNIEDVDQICINKILNDVRVVSYNPVNLLNNSEISSIRRVGIIAQELIDVMPELVDYNPEKPDDYISTNYLGFVPHLVKIVQVLDQKIKNLELQIGEMNE